MFNDYMDTKKKAVWDDIVINLSIDDVDTYKNELNTMKSNWFNVGIKAIYKKSLLKKITPILQNLSVDQQEEIDKIKSKYHKKMQKQVQDLKYDFLIKLEENKNG